MLEDMEIPTREVLVRFAEVRGAEFVDQAVTAYIAALEFAVTECEDIAARRRLTDPGANECVTRLRWIRNQFKQAYKDVQPDLEKYRT